MHSVLHHRAWRLDDRRTSEAGVPSTPTANNGDTIVVLDWAPFLFTSADHHFNVYYGTAAGGPYTTKINEATTTEEYTVTGLSNGTQYYFVVTTVDTYGNESAFSGEASATPMAAGGAATVNVARRALVVGTI